MKALVHSALILLIAGSSRHAEVPQRPPINNPDPRLREHAEPRPGPASIPSMTGWNINVVDAVEVGGALAATIVGNRAYVGFPGMVSVFDITNPAAPARLGFALLNGACFRIEVSGDYLFCITQDYPATSLQVVDATDPEHPSVVHTLAIQGYAMDLDGQYLYVQHGDDVRIHDVSNPAMPQLVGSFASYRVSDIVAQDGHVYVGRSYSPSSGLEMLDASNPIAPVQLSLLATGGGGYEIDVAGDYIFVNSFFSPSGLYVVDASNPSLPVVVNIEPAYAATNLAVEGAYAYLLDFSGFLRILDIQDPLNLVAKPLFSPCNSYALNGVDVEGDLLAIATDGVCFVDVSDADAPTSLGYYESLLPVDNLEVAGGHLALSLNHGSLVTMNRYDPSLRYFEDGAGWFIDGSRIAVKGDHAFVSICDSWGYAEDDGLEVFDLSDPTNPTLVSFLPSTWCPRGVAAGASHVYFAPYGSLWVVDVSNPSSPTKVGELPMYVRDQFVVEPYLYCVAGGVLTVVDVTDPTLPSVAASLTLGGDLEEIWVSESHAFITALHWLRIVDVTDPLNPSLAGSFPTTSAIGVHVRDHYAYVSDSSFLRIVDVSDPASPVEAGNIELGWLSASVAVAPPFVYALSGPLLVLETPLITNVPGAIGSQPSLRQNYPNPFNPSTTIAFETPARGRVRLDVFDVRGGLVRKLVDESMPAGAHTIVWDGRDSSGNVARSGVYFYRLEANGKSEAKKMVILK